MHRTQYMCADSCGHDCICQVSPCQCDAALLDGGIGRSQASPGTRNCRHRTQTVPGYPELSLSRQEHTVLAETCTITYHQKWHMLVSYHSGHFHRTFESGVTGEMRSRKHAYPAPPLSSPVIPGKEDLPHTCQDPNDGLLLLRSGSVGSREHQHSQHCDVQGTDNTQPQPSGPL